MSGAEFRLHGSFGTSCAVKIFERQYIYKVYDYFHEYFVCSRKYLPLNFFN